MQGHYSHRLANKPYITELLSIRQSPHFSPNNGEKESALQYSIIAIIGLVMLVLGFVMLPSDRAPIHSLYSSDWFWAHSAFRVVWALCDLVIVARALKRLSVPGDFVALLFLGVVYATEGSFFRLSYYLSFVQVIAVVAWFSNIPLRTNFYCLMISGLVYSGFLLSIKQRQIFPDEQINDYVVAVWIAVLGACIAAAIKDYWQRRFAELEIKAAEQNQKLSDLGRHLSIICHDMNSAMAVIQGHVELMQDQTKSQPNLSYSLSRLSEATEHIANIQKFVLGMSQDARKDARFIRGHELSASITSVLRNLCPRARKMIDVSYSENHIFYCSPAALTFAIVNAVNNSLDAFTSSYDEDTAEAQKIYIHVSLGPDDETIITIRDTGPGFPSEVLSGKFPVQYTTKGKLGHGLGLQSIRRYAEYQNGSVAAFNDGGAVVVITIPRPH